MAKSTFENRFKVCTMPNDIIDKYRSTQFYENSSEKRKRQLEIIQIVVKENMTKYEQMIFELYYIDAVTISQISKILRQNVKTLFQRLYKIHSIIKILYPIYAIDRDKLKAYLRKKFDDEQLLILSKLQKRYNIEATVILTNLSFDKVKKVRMMANKTDPNDKTYTGIYLNSIRQLNSLRRELRV